MKHFFTFAFLLGTVCLGRAQNQTDASLFLKADSIETDKISSPTGDMYKIVGHHGPAIENEWVAYRLYFDHKAAIDVYNKQKPHLELAAAGWYPTVEQQKEGWGADYYKVGSTVGLGGVRLWDGKAICKLDPVTERTAWVKKAAGISYLEMLSKGVPYKGDSVDILVRVTVYSGKREAKVEAFASKEVQFTTGVNYHKGTVDTAAKGYIATWGLHPEDVAAFPMNIGSGIVYREADMVSRSKEAKEYVLTSKPCTYLSYWISSSCEKEAELNNFESFKSYLKTLAKGLQ